MSNTAEEGSFGVSVEGDEYISILDMFAMCALVGQVSGMDPEETLFTKKVIDEISLASYDIAEGMLRERERRQP